MAGERRCILWRAKKAKWHGGAVTRVSWHRGIFTVSSFRFSARFSLDVRGDLVKSGVEIYTTRFCSAPVNIQRCITRLVAYHRDCMNFISRFSRSTLREGSLAILFRWIFFLRRRNLKMQNILHSNFASRIFFNV